MEWNDETLEELIQTLKIRFEKHSHRHVGLTWPQVQSRLELPENRVALHSLFAMEQTGGEPDVVGPVLPDGRIWYVDCAVESPKGRRSLCYDLAAWESRKEHKPEGTALDMAKDMGIELLDEVSYQKLQLVGPFDTKTSSWIKTPDAIRTLGGALFCDFRYGKVFTYHNGAESYYAARGFRGAIFL